MLSRYPATGQTPRVLVPPLGTRSLPLAENGSMRAVQPMSHLRRVRQTGRETPPPQEPNRSIETPEAILLRARNELYAKDHRRAKAVRARLLGLDPAVAPTEAQINASPRFALSLGGGGEGCARHNNGLLDAVPGGELPAG